MTAPRSKVSPHSDALADEVVLAVLAVVLPLVEFAFVGVAAAGVAVVGAAVVGAAVVGAAVALTIEGARASTAKTKPRIANEHIVWVQRDT